MKGLYARLAEWGAAFTGIGTFEGPFGNRFRLVAADDFLKPFPDANTEDLPPGGDSEGLGIVSVRFDAPRGASGAICEFYSSIFGAAAEAGAGRCVVRVGAQIMTSTPSTRRLGGVGLNGLFPHSSSATV